MKKVKFDSAVGYALTGAKDGERFIFTYKVSCEDARIPKEDLDKITEETIKSYAYQELHERAKAGRITLPYPLHDVHVIMYPDESRNEILLNEQVRFVGNVILSPGISPKFKQNMKANEIERILNLYPSRKNDPDAAHIMLTKLNGRWYFACDLIYNRKRVKNRFATARQFLKTADYCKENLMGPFVDNLFSATELAIQSILLLHHFKKYSLNQSHDDTKKIFREFTSNGNLETKFADHYDTLDDLRDKGRYLNGLHGREFSLQEERASELFDITMELFEKTEERLAQVDLSRKPKAGHYIVFGQG